MENLEAATLHALQHVEQSGFQAVAASFKCRVFTQHPNSFTAILVCNGHARATVVYVAVMRPCPGHGVAVPVLEFDSHLAWCAFSFFICVRDIDAIGVPVPGRRDTSSCVVPAKINAAE